MQKFKVITLSLGGHSNKVFQSQAIVTAADFPSEENVWQHVLTGGLHPLNEDGTEMERIIITQEMIDEGHFTGLATLAKIIVKPGMRTYLSATAHIEQQSQIEPAEVEENVETVMDTTQAQIGEAIEQPRTEVPNDKPLVEEPAVAPAPKAANKKSNAKK